MLKIDSVLTVAANKPKEDEEGDITELFGSVERSHSPTLCDFNFDSRFEARNYPYMTWTYIDHTTKNDMVCIAVLTIPGSRDRRADFQG